MKKLTEPKNEFGYDLVRVFAMFSVISLHFFLHCGFYGVESQGAPAIIYGIIRMLFYQCVPTFIMLTGALNRKAIFAPKYYIKIVPIITNSLVVGIVVIAYKIFILHENFHPLVWLQSLWTLNQPGYGWYVNLYLSLFLLIPLINLAYNSLKTRKQKIMAVMICIIVTNLAISINRLKFDSEYIHNIGFVPNYFNSLWPLGYYAVGMYIGEYRPKMKKWVCALMLISLLLAQASLNYYTTPDNYYGGITFNNEDVVNVATSLLLFLLLYDIKIKNIPIRRIFAFIASLSMTFYLISYIGDCYFYSKYGSEFSGYASYPKMYLKIIPLHFVLCILASAVINFIVKFISKLITKPLYKLCEKNNSES